MKKHLYSVYTNDPNSTEKPTCLGIFESLTTASRFSAGKGFAGTCATISETEVQVIFGMKGEYVPLSAVPVTKPSPADIDQDIKRALEKQKNAVIEKMKAVGFTKEEIMLVTGIPQTFGSKHGDH